MKKNEEKWRDKYECLKSYVQANGHLPDKRRIENRGLLNWWKYNRRLLKQDRLNAERAVLLQELSEMRNKL